MNSCGSNFGFGSRGVGKAMKSLSAESFKCECARTKQRKEKPPNRDEGDFHPPNSNKHLRHGELGGELSENRLLEISSLLRDGEEKACPTGSSVTSGHQSQRGG